MNIVILSGRLTRDPKITTSESGKKIARYTLAVDRKKEGTDFIQCKAFDKGADFAESWLHQGTKINVEGRIDTGSYVNKDGQKVYTTDVLVYDQEFAEKKAASEKDSVSTGKKPKDEGGFLDVPQDFSADGLPFV